MAETNFTQRRLNATPRGIGVMSSINAVRAENATLWDSAGRTYTDFAGGIAVLNTGHRHPRIKAAIAAQLEQFTHTCYQVVPYEAYVSLAERINAIVPITGSKKTAFFTTGVEAVENAVKIARCHTGRTGVIAFGGSFHGRSMLGMALTGKVASYKKGFGPMPAEIFHVPFPSDLQGITVARAMEAIDHLLKTDIDPQRVAAIIVEPVQGEGGFNVAPRELMTALRQLCDQHGILLIVDEVQTGFGRTGRMFAMEHFGVSADLMVVAKSLGAGLPISGVCGKAEIMDAPVPGSLGGTYAGNPLAVAAAHAVLDVIADEKLCARALELGTRLMDRLHALAADCPSIAEVRGLGSMVAFELRDPSTGAPDAAAVARIQAEALERGLILLSCGANGNVIRCLYPLTIPDAQFDAALDLLASVVLDAVALEQA